MTKNLKAPGIFIIWIFSVLSVLCIPVSGYAFSGSSAPAEDAVQHRVSAKLYIAPGTVIHNQNKIYESKMGTGSPAVKKRSVPSGIDKNPKSVQPVPSPKPQDRDLAFVRKPESSELLSGVQHRNVPVPSNQQVKITGTLTGSGLLYGFTSFITVLFLYGISLVLSVVRVIGRIRPPPFVLFPQKNFCIKTLPLVLTEIHQ